MKKMVYVGIVVLLVAGIIYTLTSGKKEENMSNQNPNTSITPVSSAATPSAELKIEDIK